jgi:O-antigen/teichoic acid export membrane protein
LKIAHRIAKNTTFIFLSGVLTRAFSLIFIVYAARKLGPSDFGIYALLMAIRFFLSFFLDFGIAPMAVRELSRNRERIQSLFNHILTLRVSLSLVLLAIIVLSVNIIGYDERMKVLVYIISLAFVFNAFSGSFRVLYYSMERMKFPSALNVGVSMLITTASIAVLHSGYGLEGIVLVMLCGRITGAVISGIWTRAKIIKYGFAFDFMLWFDLLKQAFPYGLIGFLNRLNRHLTILLLSKMHGPYTPDIAMGLYSPAQKAANSLRPVIRSLRVASLPTIASKIDKKNMIQKITEKITLFFLLTVSIPLFVSALFFSRDLMIFVFGVDYADSSTAFLILGIANAIYSFNASLTSSLSATRDIYRFTPWAASSVIITLLLCIILIPIMSFKGAAIAVLVSNIFRSISVHILLKRIMGIRIGFEVFKRPFILLLFISTVCIILNTSGMDFIPRIAIALSIYVMCVILFFRREFLVFKDAFFKSGKDLDYEE